MMSNSSPEVVEPEDRSTGVGPGAVVPGGLAAAPAAGVALAVAAYLAVFVSVTDIVGGTTRMVVAVLIAVGAGVALARVLQARAAILASVVMLVIGFIGYYAAVPKSQRALLSVSGFAFDTFSMLTGLSVLRLVQADIWVLVVAPIPTFLAAYLTARGRYTGAVTVCAGVLGFFVLTGDAGTTATLLGVVGIAGSVGLDTISVPSGATTQLNTLTIIITLMLITSATLTLIPSGAAEPWTGGPTNPSVESSVVGSEESLEVVGAVQLDPAVRFVVQSDVESKWHVSSFDRYTGDGWVRTGDNSRYDGPLAGSTGDGREITQVVTAQTDIEAFPAAWAPVAVTGAGASTAQVSARGGIQPSATIREGESFTVTSESPQASDSELRAAGDSYPAEIETTHTQLPESTSDRVGEVTADIVETADTDNPYDTALAVERYLEETKTYSLQVQRPDGDIAGSFLTQMDAGYCVYFATTMVAMLRTQGIPAKFVTGYTSGEQVSENEYVVRGQNAHAWVMVYFPEYGWIEFDPTPATDRQEARDVRLADARQTDRIDVDTEQTNSEPQDTAGGDSSETNQQTSESEQSSGDTENPVNVSPGAPNDVINPELREGELPSGPRGGVSGADTRQILGIPVPDRQTVGYAVLVMVGLLTGAHRSGLTSRAYRAVWLHTPRRRRDPVSDTEKAFARLEFVLERRYRPRHSTETTREYLAALESHDIDERVYTVADIYERAVYRGSVSRREANEAISLVRRLLLESIPIIRRFVA